MFRVLSSPLNRSPDPIGAAATAARGKSLDRTGQAQILGALIGRSIQSSKVEGSPSTGSAMSDATGSIRNVAGGVAFAKLTRGSEFARIGASIAVAVACAEKDQFAKADVENDQEGLDPSFTDDSSNGSVDGAVDLSKQDVQKIAKAIGEAAKLAFPKSLAAQAITRGDMRDCAEKLEVRLGKAQESRDGVARTDDISRAIKDILS